MASYKTISAPFKFSGSLNNFERDVIEKAKMADKKSYGAYPDLFTVICSDYIPDPKDPSKTIPGPDHGKLFVIDKSRDLDPEYGYCVPVGGDLPDNVTETFEEMPDPEEREENEIVQYVGPTTDDFDNGNFYKNTRVEGEIPQLFPLSGNYTYNFGGEDKEIHVISTSATPEVGDKIYALTFDADKKAQLTEVGTIKTTDPSVTLEGLGGDPDTEAEAISNLIDSFDASSPEKTPEVSDEPRPYDPTETPYKFPDYLEWKHVSQGEDKPFNGDKFEINMDNFKKMTEFVEFTFADFMTKATYKYNDTIEYVAWDDSTSPLKDDVIVLGGRDSIPGKTVDEYFVATDYGDPITIGFRATNNTDVASAKIVKVMASENGATPTAVPIITEPNDRIYAVMSVLPPSASTTNTVNFVIYLEDGKTMTYNVKLTNKVSNAVWYGYIPVDPAGTIALDSIPYETVDKALNETKTIKSKVVVINDSPRVDTPIDNNIDVNVTCSGSDNGHIAFFIPSLPADHVKDHINMPAIIDKNRLDNTDSFVSYNVKDASGNFRGFLAVSKETPTCTNFKYSLIVNKFVTV